MAATTLKADIDQRQSATFWEAGDYYGKRQRPEYARIPAKTQLLCEAVGISPLPLRADQIPRELSEKEPSVTERGT